MGIEYCHGLAVADLAWEPTRAAVECMHTLLRTWRLAKATPKIVEHGRMC